MCHNTRSYFAAILPDQALRFGVTLLLDKLLRSSELLSVTYFAENSQRDDKHS